MKKSKGKYLWIINDIFIFALVLLVWASAVFLANSEETELIEYEYVPTRKAINTEPIESMDIEHTHMDDVQMDIVELSYEDAQLLMKIAQAEAGNQGTDGMWLVMSVVYNRVNNPEFPDSYYDVIYQPYQFYTDGIGLTEISPECHEALARIEKGDIAPEIVAFEKVTNNSLEKYFCSAFNYRDHQFYTAKE